MTTITIRVQDDFLERVSHVAPLLAIEELIWNGLDADATEVRVTFDLNELEGVVGIRVWDNGTGIPYSTVERTFGNLGGSWKRETRRSQTHNRVLHGQAGRGRIRAFRLGGHLEWKTCYDEAVILQEFKISSSHNALGTFEVSVPQPSSADDTNTEVIISDVTTQLSSLLSHYACEHLTQQFALYLTNYPDVRIWYHDAYLDPEAAILERHHFSLESTPLSDDTLAPVDLEVIEWKSRTSRTFVLCDPSGFARHEMSTPMHTQGYDFTAYIKTSAFAQLDEDNGLSLEEMDPTIYSIVENAKDTVREHFRLKTAQASVDFVDRWKHEHVYPFLGEAKSPIEKTQRQTFDVLALALNTYLPGFQKASTKQQELTLRLLKHSMESGGGEVVTILQDVLDLPLDKQTEMTRLLSKTSLSAMINSSKLVADRLDFLRGLETLVGDPLSQPMEANRTQLNKIVEQETWIFGEQFNLSVGDRTLSAILQEHTALLPQSENTEDTIGDLMLTCRAPQSSARTKHYLVADIKRPGATITADSLQQFENFAQAVADDIEFHKTDIRWIFWTLANDISEDAQQKANHAEHESGLVFVSSDTHVEVWAKTWSQIIAECRERLTFYQETLEYDADNESAIQYLRQTNKKLQPASVGE